MKLYGYFRSSAAYRVRIGLNLKGLDREDVSVKLASGEQHSAEYRALNPHGLVPALVYGDAVLAQSLAILEYLDEVHPEPPILPREPAGRARVRGLAYAIACEVHPLQNLRVRQHLGERFGASLDDQNAWCRHWIEAGFTALERQLAGDPATGCFCHGDTPSIADACLVPQLYNARRYGCDLSACPEIVRIDAECTSLDAFASAAPERQPDAE